MTKEMIDENALEKAVEAYCNVAEYVGDQGCGLCTNTDEAVRASVEAYEAAKIAVLEPQELLDQGMAGIIEASIFGMAASKKRGVAQAAIRALRVAGYRIVKGGA